MPSKVHSHVYRWDLSQLKSSYVFSEINKMLDCGVKKSSVVRCRLNDVTYGISTIRVTKTRGKWKWITQCGCKALLITSDLR